MLSSNHNLILLVEFNGQKIGEYYSDASVTLHGSVNFFCRNFYRVIQQNINQELTQQKRSLSPISCTTGDDPFVGENITNTRRASELSVSVPGLQQRRKSEFLVPLEPHFEF
ncbi:hypothetical protein Mgra_00007751 [Meloidogyne graminicola]|uniref:Uncharacterized protein n=1 Tax=Meloidogyne graminicola TaxID=189291 RepID=A0A8S9ZI37_9BILA|nr:hypothetical protein Mgra_00007751 [Meloidogyne graminicola]